jgi:hypothetical protein
MSPAPSASSRKPPNIWALASVTYGAVIAVTIVSIVAYLYLAPKRTESQQLTDAERSVAVGSVWIPVYPGATVEGTTYGKRENVTESTLNFETKDQSDRVLAFYQAALKKGVFRFNTVTKTDAGGTVRSVVHAGKTTVVVTIRTTAEGSGGEIKTVDKAGDKDTRN